MTDSNLVCNKLGTDKERNKYNFKWREEKNKKNRELNNGEFN